MKKTICLIAVLYCFLAAVFIDDTYAVIYRYINKEGIVCFADDLQAVPLHYRATALIVEGEEKEDAARSSGMLIAQSDSQSAAAVPGKQKIRAPRPLSFRLMISATVSLAAL